MARRTSTLPSFHPKWGWCVRAARIELRDDRRPRVHRIPLGLSRGTLNRDGVGLPRSAGRSAPKDQAGSLRATEGRNSTADARAFLLAGETWLTVTTGITIPNNNGSCVSAISSSSCIAIASPPRGAAKPAPSVHPITEGEARGDLSHTTEVGPEPGAIVEDHGGETHGFKPTDDEILTTLVAFYGRKPVVIVEWLASMRAVRRSVMLSMGDA